MKKEYKIKVLAFDIGSVLDIGEVRIHYRSLCKAINIKEKVFEKVWLRYRHAASEGRINAKQFVSQIAHDLKIDSSFLFNTWMKIKTKNVIKNKELENFIKKLKHNGYIIGSLTNVTALHDIARNKRQIYDVFDFNVISYQVKCNKPKQKIYKIFIKKAKVKPQEIVFIDDGPWTLPPARKLGMKTILFKNNKQLFRDLKKIGVEA